MARRTSTNARTPLRAPSRVGGVMATPIGRVLARAGVLALALLAAGLLMRQARAQAYRLPGYRLGPTSIRFADLPPWADDAVRAALHDTRRLSVSVSVFDAAAEDRIREVVAEHPMVAEVRSVSVEYPNRATVRVGLRTPIAYVQVGRPPDGTWRLLSEDRHVLDPAPYRGWLEHYGAPLPWIVGVRTRTPGVGQAWEDRDEQVAEGVEAAIVAGRLYRDLGGRVVVRAVDVSRFPARPEDRAGGEVRFLLADGRVVEWGRTERDPGEAGEDGYAWKRRRLEAYLTDETLKGRTRIDVRYRMRFEARLSVP
jgi:hypothetical protein